MDNYFIKYQEDILKAYKNLNNNIECKTIFTEFNKNASSLLLEIINSYYFENNFKATLSEGHNHLKINFNGKKSFAPFIDMRIYNNFSDNGVFDIDLDIDLNKIKEELVNVDPFYLTLFETDPLKRQLNLIKKNEISYSIVKVEDDPYNSLKEFHNIIESSNPFNKKDNDYYQSYHLEEELKTVYDIPFVSFEYNLNRHFVVAHNHNQIVGLTSLTNFSMLFNEEEKNSFIYDKLIYNSYMSVSKHFRGNNIAFQMMQKSIEFAKDNNLIFIRSRPTEDGRAYIEKKIDTLVAKDTDLVCINDDSRQILSDIKDILISIKDEESYLNVFNKLNPLAKKINSDISNKYIKLDTIDDYEDRMKLIDNENLKYSEDILIFKNQLMMKKKSITLKNQ